MDVRKIDDYMRSYLSRKDALHLKLAEAARSIVPVLKDHNLSNTASELERLLFEYDANEQEMTKMALDDPAAFVEALLLKMGKTPL